MTEQRPVDLRSEDDPCRISVDLRKLRPHGLHAWRLLLIADVLRAVLETVQRRRVQTAVLEREGLPPGMAATTYNSAVWVTTPAAAAAALGGSPAFYLEPVQHRADGDGDDGDGATRNLQIGSVRPPAGTENTIAGVLGEYDPLTLRLVLLRFAPARPAALSVARLHRAQQTLERWRYKVALWADMPAAAPVDELLDAAHAALEATLDTVTVLTQLHRLEVDPSVASGAKFATFARLDTILGLDLGHLVGKIHR